MDGSSIGDITLQTLVLLEWRLKRLEFLLTGTDSTIDTNSIDTSIPVTKRLQKLEQSLHKLATKSETVSSILSLQTQHPDLFSPTTTKTSTPIPSIHQATTILSHAPQIQSTASQLRSLQDSTTQSSSSPGSLPPTTSFTNLVLLAPRINELARKQDEQGKEVAELRKRSALAVLRWQEIFVVGQGRCWVEWEGRVRKVERDVRREEVLRERDEEG